jgi:hypothetical protein
MLWFRIHGSVIKYHKQYNIPLKTPKAVFHYSVVDPHLVRYLSGFGSRSSFSLDANPDPGSQTNADPDPCHLSGFVRVEFLEEK